MKLRLLLYVSFALFIFTSNANAQEKASRDAVIWPQWQLRYVFPEQHMLFFQNQFRYNTNDALNQLGPMERVQFRLGYEHAFTDHWRGGLSERYALEKHRHVLFTEVYLMHLGKIGSLNFIKRASFEHLLEKERDNSGRVRFFAQLDKNFEVGNIRLAPALAAEFFFYQDFKEEDPYRWEERMVDRSRLRVAFTVAPTKQFAITPYFTRQIDYQFLEATFDENGNIKRPGGKWNISTAIWGLDLSYTFPNNADNTQNILRNR